MGYGFSAMTAEFRTGAMIPASCLEGVAVEAGNSHDADGSFSALVAVLAPGLVAAV